MRVTISNMQASRVNLHQNHFAAGLPPLTAFMGLAACIFHELGFDRHAVRVIPVIHDLYVSQGRTRSEMGNKSGRWAPQEIPEDMHGNVVFSLILDLPDVCDLQDVEQAIIGKRLAGGPIFPAIREKGFAVREVADGAACFKGLPRGRIIKPMAGMPVSFGDQGTLWPVADAYLPEISGTEVDASAPRGWRVPIAIGYRLIGELNEVPPQGARDNVTPHTFAEPGVSVAELVSIRNPRLTHGEAAEVNELFFNWSSTGHHITVHQFYNPSIEV